MMDHLSGERWQMKKKKEKAKQEEPAAPPPPPVRAGYRTIITDDAQRSMDELPRNVQKAMLDKVEQLQSYPEVSGIRRMFGDAKGKQRLKFWDWRMEFSVDENAQTITVDKVGHRDTMYDEYHP